MNDLNLAMASVLTVMQTMFLFLLQVPQGQSIDFLTIADKLTTVGILIFISYSLNKKIDEMSKQFREEEREIRKDFKDSLTEINKGFEGRLSILINLIKDKKIAD